jgi:O-antigen/teichoic acid export membrane protein
MPRLIKNISANFAGSMWSVIASVVCAPIYLKYVGVERYGLIGTYTVLQSCLALLDFGMGHALIRAFSRSAGEASDRRLARDLMRSTEVIFVSLALLTFAILTCASAWLTAHWINVDRISSTEVVNALRLMAVILAIRLVENIYRAALIGLQRQVKLNVIAFVMTTCRTFGAVLVLEFISPSTDMFFICQGVVAGVSAVAMAIAVYSSLPFSEHAPRFSWSAIGSISGYAGGVLGVSLLSFIIVQFDKILMIKFHSLSDYGIYMLALLAASSVTLPVGPITSAILPNLSRDIGGSHIGAALEKYHVTCHFLSCLVATIGFLLLAFSGDILYLWTSDASISQNASLILKLYVIGGMFSAVMEMPYVLQLAHGVTKLALINRAILAIIIGITLLLAIPKFGGVGAAFAWALINLLNFLVFPHFIYRFICKTEKRRWYTKDVGVPFAISAIVIGISAYFIHPSGKIETLFFIALCGTVSLCAGLLSSADARRVLFRATGVGRL